MDYSFTVLNTRQTYKLKCGHNLLNNLLLHNIKTHAKCGGKAICGRCRVKISCGLNYCNKPAAEEKVVLTELELEQGWRLTCQTYCLKSINLYLPSQDELE